MVQEVCFVDVDVWGAQADSCNQYLQKGRGVLIEGRLKLDTWVDNDGNRKSKHSIVADRVTFMPTAASAQSDENFEFGASAEPKAPEKKAESAQTAPEAPKTPEKQTEPAQAAPAGEVNLKEQAPFEDDLPF